jgi:diguanylate cyclase (GGDEF)-like protein
MNSFTFDLDAMLTVAAGVLDANGVLLEANAGLLRLLPAACAPPIGTKVARYFIQPSFATLADGAGRNEYHGLLTIGDYAGTTRTLRGRVWRTAADIRVLAEYDIAELEKLNDAILELNREASIAQRSLTHANVSSKQREVQVVEASLTDALTGVGNRRKLDQALATEISRVRRHGGTLSAIMADVDHFKRVNDEYGHGAGDKVLARFGALLRIQTRATDVVARFGGEEFVVLMPHTSLAQAVLRAEQLRSSLAAELIAPLTKPVTASFGVAMLAHGEEQESLLSRIDAALYRAKDGGRNKVVAAASFRSPAKAV